jgi:hypothetical protein
MVFMKYLEDVLFMLGLVLLGVGLAFKFDWPTALIICGSIILLIPTVSALRGSDDVPT